MKLNVQIDGQKFEVEVGSLEEKPVQVVVDGERFDVWVEEDNSSMPVAEVANSTLQSGQSKAVEVKPVVLQGVVNTSKSVTAPIPGVILSISAKTGDVVKTGQELCVLEAMKMKNIIRAARDGKIAAIHVSAGDHVSHGQALMDFSE